MMTRLDIVDHRVDVPTAICSLLLTQNVIVPKKWSSLQCQHVQLRNFDRFMIVCPLLIYEESVLSAVRFSEDPDLTKQGVCTVFSELSSLKMTNTGRQRRLQVRSGSRAIKRHEDLVQAFVPWLYDIYKHRKVDLRLQIPSSKTTKSSRISN